MKTIRIAILFGLILISGAAFSEDRKWDVYANDFDVAEQAAITQCVANNPGSSRLRCGRVTCGRLANGRTGCYVPEPMSDEEVAELRKMGYSDDGSYE